MEVALASLALCCFGIAVAASLTDRSNQRAAARTVIGVAGVIFKPRRSEFRGELAAIQELHADTGLSYALGALLGASVERAVSVGRPLRIENVSKTFGTTRAVAGLSLEVPVGTITALLGGNGAGKSTLINLIDGEHAPDSGRIRFGDVDLNAPAGRDVRVIKQDLGLFEELTVAQNIAIATPGGGWMINHRAEVENARVALAVVGSAIDPTLRVADLGRSDRHIVAIARAVADRAQVIVLDEPSANLDRAGTRQLFTTLDIVRARGLGLLFVSHRLDEVLDLADRVAVMRDGELVFEGSTAETNADALVKHIVGPRIAA